MFDHIKYAVIGAGISGLTVARLIAEQLDREVLIIEKRRHIGGNCYDYYNQDGILVHKYGPHIFHTQNRRVFAFLSRFTEWNFYQHKVLTYVDGNLLPMPICAKTINMLFNMNLSCTEVQSFLDSVRDKDRKINNSEDVVLQGAGTLIYEKFFKNYTKKQWDAYPSELSPQVISRVPIRTSNDDRYFTDQYQGMPALGYTELLNRMADHSNIRLILGTDYRTLGDLSDKSVICTAPIDEYFGYALGALKYRSLDIRLQSHHMTSYQPAAVINYPNDYDFTRITEYTKLTGQKRDTTVISLEYPTWEGEPYYPVMDQAQQSKYNEYKALAAENVYFLGRLGEYRYYNMDAAVNAAFTLFDSFAPTR